MADIDWVGRAADIAQRDTITIALVWASGDTVTLRSHDAEIVITIGTSIGTDDVALAIVAAINGTAETNETRTTDGTKIPGLTGNGQAGDENRVTAAIDPDDSSIVWVTGRPGHPFDLELSYTTAGTGTATLLSDGTGDSVLATGKHFYDDVDNWSTGALPGATDTSHFRYGNVDVLYNLDAASMADHDTWVVWPTFEGNVGLPPVIEDNPAEEMHYQTTFARHATTTGNGDLTLKPGLGAGSQRLNFNFSGQTTGACQFVSHKKGTRDRPDHPVVEIINAGNLSIYVTQCDARVKYSADAGVGSAKVWMDTPNRQADDAYLELEKGALGLLSAIEKDGGTLVIDNLNQDSILNKNGTLELRGANADCAALVVEGGEVFDNAGGDLTGTTVIQGTGLLSYRNSTEERGTKGFTLIELHGKQSRFDDPKGIVNALAVDLIRGATAGQITHQSHRTVTFSAV